MKAKAYRNGGEMNLALLASMKEPTRNTAKQERTATGAKYHFALHESKSIPQRGRDESANAPYSFAPILTFVLGITTRDSGIPTLFSTLPVEY